MDLCVIVEVLQLLRVLMLFGTVIVGYVCVCALAQESYVLCFAYHKIDFSCLQFMVGFRRPAPH